MKKLLVILLCTALLLVSLPLVTSCGSSATTTTSPTSTPSTGQKYGGTLTVAEPIFPGLPLGFPPERGFAEVIFQQPCLEPLLQQNIDGSFIPRLATEWTVADDGSSVTFKLRQGVKFHDGSDFNAEVVKWNFDEEIPTQKASNINWASVDVIDTYTVRVNLKAWINSGLSDFSFEGGNYIISKAAYDKNGIEWVREHMVGTGPFKQKDYQRDAQVVFEKFDDYWMEGKPYVDEIIYKVVADPMTQQAALKSKELDGMASGADKNLADLVASGLVAVTGQLGVGGFFPSSADANSPLANAKVREALEYAIDKEAIASAFSFGFWGPAYQFAPPSSAAYDDSLIKRTYDPEKAKQLLTEAGYPNGFEMNLLATNDDPGKSISVAVQNNWQEIGLTVNIEILESAKFEEYGRTGWDGMLYAAPQGASNWHRALQGVLPPDTVSGYVSVAKPQQYIDLFNAAANSPMYDPAKEKALVKYITDTSMCLPVWNLVRAWVVQPYVKDGGFLSQGAGFFWNADNIWLDK